MNKAFRGTEVWKNCTRHLEENIELNKKQEKALRGAVIQKKDCPLYFAN